MSTSSGVMVPQRAGRGASVYSLVGWLFAAVVVTVILCVVSIVLAALPDTERTLILVGLAAAVVVLLLVGWLEQERSPQGAYTLLLIGALMFFVVLDVDMGAMLAQATLNWMGARVVDLLELMV